MSTRSTIIHGEDFHLYSEMMDEENVYLELDNADFEAYRNTVILTIPAAIWQSIRRYKFDMALVDATDEQIEEDATQSVDKQIREYNDHLPTCKLCARGDTICFNVFYHMGESRDERIDAGIAYRKADRERQQRIRDEMATHEPGGLFEFNLNEGTANRISTADLEPV